MLKNNDLVKNIIVLIMGSGTAKIIGFASVLVLTRIYTPENFGVFNVYLSLVVLLGPLVAMRYPLAIPLPRNQISAYNLLVFCLLAAGIFSTVIYLVLVFNHPIQEILNINGYSPLFFIILSVSIFIYSVHESLVSWNVRRKNFKKVAVTEATVSLVSALTKILIPIAGLSLMYGLVFGHLVGVIVGVLFLCFTLTKPKIGSSWKNIRRVSLMYSDFPKFRLPSQFFMLLSAQLPILVFNANFGKAETGQLGLAISVIAVPMMLIANTASQAYHGEVANLGKKQAEKIYSISIDLCKKMAMIGVVPAVFLAVAGEFLFGLFFGTTWNDAGIFASLLSVMLFFQFIANPIGHALSVFKRNDLFLLLNFCRAIMVVLCFVIGTHLQTSPFKLVFIYSLVMSIFYVGYATFVLIFLKRHANRLVASV